MPLETEFDNISGVITQVSAGLGAFPARGCPPRGGLSGGNVGIGSGFSTRVRQSTDWR